ncbi:MAG: thiamine diphosphokinase [Candidatus Limnocylindrales bacterium]
MHALILADGDAPDRAALDRTWPGWDDGVALIIAADGGARSAAPLGLRLDRWVGDGDSIGEAELADLIAGGVRVDRAPTDKDESDTELAIDAALAAGADRLTILGALGGSRFDHALANLGLLAVPALAGLDVRILAPTARIRLLIAPGPDGQAAVLDLPGTIGDLVSLLPAGEDADGVTTTGLRYPLNDEPLQLGRTRGLSNVRTSRDGRVAVRAGRLLVVESPATILPMLMPSVGDAAPEIALSDDTGTTHRLSDQRGRWTILYFYPTDDTPGCTVEACEFRDANETLTERGADVWGISPQGAPSKKAFRAKFQLPFTLLADEDHAIADAYGSWVEKQKYGKTYWGTARSTFLVDPEGRIAQTWSKVKAEGHAAEVLAALDAAQAAAAQASAAPAAG